MDEIFLNDYANNVAMAQQPNGLAAIYNQPGFEGYVPSFSVVDQPMVNQSLNLTDTGGINLPQIKDIAKNVLVDRAKSYALKKIGLDGLKGNILKGIVNPYVGLASFLPENVNPIGALQNLNTQVQSSLFGRSRTMADFLAAKRAQKAAERDYQRDTQGDIKTTPARIMNIQPTAEDIYRGGGGENKSYSSPARTSQGVTSAQHSAFRR